jgi:hypothetical protein
MLLLFVIVIVGSVLMLVARCRIVALNGVARILSSLIIATSRSLCVHTAAPADGAGSTSLRRLAIQQESAITRLWLLLTTFASTAASTASVDSGIVTLRSVTATGSSERDASVTKDDIRSSSRSVSTVWRCRSR